MMVTRRLAGTCSVIGGASWTAACFVHNALPQGCVGDECVDRPLRGSTPVGLTLVLAAAMSGGLGLVLLGAAGAVSMAIDSDWDGMPGLVVPGVLLLTVGLLLVAAAVVRAGVVPVWVSSLLVATALLLPFANEQTSRILLTVPFGLCWLGLGVELLRRSSDPDQPSVVS